MFGLFKKKAVEIVAPCSGEAVALERVDDPVFAGGLAGEGVAIEPSSGEFRAPISGKITKLFVTKHAYIVSNEHISVMVHIGIDTVALGEEGFEAFIKEGDKVKVGDVIIKADLEVLRQKAKALTTPVLITQESHYKKVIPHLGVCKQGERVMEVV